jgi:hypothetical protein
MSEPFDLSSTYVHLGLGSTAEPLPDFEFSAEYLSAYGARTEGDGDDGRLVLCDRQDASWQTSGATGWRGRRARVGMPTCSRIDGEVHEMELTPAWQ